jgi:hypothetical protein
MGRFRGIIQAIYLSSMGSGHIIRDSHGSVSRDSRARNLDATLHSFGSVLYRRVKPMIDIVVLLRCARSKIAVNSILD